MYMAASEMDHMKELNDEIAKVIQSQNNNITFYYGPKDKWAPLSYYEDMKKRFPDGDIRLCPKNYCHDFVLDSSVGMGDVAFDILKSYNLV